MATTRYLCFERVEKWADDYDEFMKALRVTDLTDSEPIILLGMYGPMIIGVLSCYRA